MMGRIVCICIFLIAYFIDGAFAQKDSITIIDLPNDAVENLIQSTQNDNGFDLNTAFEKLDWYKKHQLDLNTATAEQLSELGLLTTQQTDNLIQHRERFGKLITIYELQAIPSFTIPVIKRILPFVAVNTQLNENTLSFKQLWQKSENELFVRTGSLLEETSGIASGKYLGNSLEHYVRFRKMFGNRFSIGLTLEKDAGEPYRYGKKIRGADFIGAHFRYATQRYTFIVGDFAASFGQGLILMQDFTPGKSPFITDIKRAPRALRPYTSVGEANFFRGLAFGFRPNKNIEGTVFASYRKRDATLQLDTLNFFNEFSSFQISGLHRTINEISAKNVVTNFTFGGSLKYKKKRWNVGLNAMYNHFDRQLNIDQKLYNKFYFNGNQLLNVSSNYSYIYKNINFFGETAISDNGGTGTMNGLLVGLDKSLQFSMLYRNYQRNFQTLFANPIAEYTGARNEKGLYFGFVFTPKPAWKLETFADFWRNPWLRYQVDAPSVGYEYYARLTYIIKRKLEVYAQYRAKQKQRNDVTNGNDILPDFTNEHRNQYRLNLSYMVTPQLEWQSRAEASRVKGLSPQPSYGYMIYQDVIWKSKVMPFSMSARYAIFNTDDYNSRIYAYENALMYNFSIPPYYGKGRRTYLNIRYTGIKNMMIEGRISRTYLPNQTTIGSGNDAIQGNTKTEIGAQIKYKF